MRIRPLSFNSVFCLIFAAPLFAQEAKLIAEGKKEGKVVVYGSMESDIFDGIEKSFERILESRLNIGARLRRFGPGAGPQ